VFKKNLTFIFSITGIPIKQGNQQKVLYIKLVGRIERALDAKEYTLGVFFDIEGAFDNTTMDSIRTILDDWKVYRSVRNWIIALIKERKFVSKYTMI